MKTSDPEKLAEALLSMRNGGIIRLAENAEYRIERPSIYGEMPRNIPRGFGAAPTFFPDIDGPVVIEGNRSRFIIGTRDPLRFFRVRSRGRLVLKDIDLWRGYAAGVNAYDDSGMGGAIYNEGELLLNQVGIVDCRVEGGSGTGVGSAVYNDGGSVWLQDVLLANNTCRSAGAANPAARFPESGVGAIFNLNGKVTVKSVEGYGSGPQVIYSKSAGGIASVDFVEAREFPGIGVVTDGPYSTLNYLPAGAFSDDFYGLKSLFSGLLVDVQPLEGAPLPSPGVQLMQRQQPSDLHLWQLTHWGNNQYAIGHRGGLMLGAAENSATALGAVTLQNDDGGLAQRWGIAMIAPGVVNIINAKSLLALTIGANAVGDGALVVQAPWIGATSQMWSIAK